MGLFPSIIPASTLELAAHVILLLDGAHFHQLGIQFLQLLHRLDHLFMRLVERDNAFKIPVTVIVAANKREEEDNHKGQHSSPRS